MTLQTSDEAGGELDPAARLREELARLLAEGDEAELARFARRAVGAAGTDVALAVGAVVVQLPGDAGALAGLAGQPRCWRGCWPAATRGGMAEQVARGEVRERLATFKAAVDTEVRRRQADERGRERIAKSAVQAAGRPDRLPAGAAG